MSLPNQTLIRTTDIVGDRPIPEIGNSGEDVFALDLDKIGARLRSPGLLTITGVVLSVGNTTIETGPFGRRASLSIAGGVDLGGLSGTFDFATGTGTADVQSVAVPVVAANFFVKAGVEVRKDQKIYVVFGTPAASATAAGAPAFGKSSSQLGMLVLQRNPGGTAFLPQADNSAIRQFGSGSGGESGVSRGVYNYVTNPDAELDTSGWVAYNDGPSLNPVDGVGGTPTIALSRESSAPLFETGSFRVSKPASNCQGQGVSTDLLSIHASDAGRIWEFRFVYGVSANFVSGDVTVHLYDKTNSQLIAVFSPSTLPYTEPNTKGVLRGLFAPNQAQAAAREFRAIVHISGTTATSWNLDFDSVEIRPYTQEDAVITEKQVIGTPIRGQVAALTSTGDWTTLFVRKDAPFTRLGYLQLDLGNSIYQIIEKGRVFNCSATPWVVGSPYWFNGSGLTAVPVVGRDPVLIADTPRTAIFDGSMAIDRSHEDLNRVLLPSAAHLPAGLLSPITGVLQTIGATVTVGAGDSFRSGKRFEISFTAAGQIVDFFADVRALDFSKDVSVGMDYEFISGVSPDLHVFQDTTELTPVANGFNGTPGLYRDFVRTVTLLSFGVCRVRIKSAGAAVLYVDGVRLKSFVPVIIPVNENPVVYTVTTNITTGDAGRVIYGNSATPITFNLPTATGNDGLTFNIKSIGIGNVVIDPSGSQLIDGDSTHILNQYDSVKIVAFGGAWYVH